MTSTVLLGDVCAYITEKVSVDSVRLEDYVSTENLLPNKEGLSLAANLPQAGKVTRYKKGDVLVSNIRPYFKKIWQADRDGGASNDVLVFRPTTEKLVNAYLYYILKDDKFFDFSTASSSGSKMPRGDKTQIMKYSVYLPDVETQQKITDILGAIDEKIELNRKMNETLEQMEQALFRHYFIDNPEAEKWEYVPISELCDKVSSGGTPATKREDYYGGNVQWYSTKELKDGFLFGSEKTITDEGLSNSAAKLFPKNTVMMAIYAAPTVGRLGILTSEASFNQATCGLVAKPEIGYEFVYLYLLLSRAELNNMANGAAQQNISVGKVRDFKVMRPDNTALSGFREHIAPIFAQIKNNSEEIQTLTTLRDTLLPRLINGKVKV